MALIQCPECGKQVSNSAKNCPNCGYPIAENSNDTIRIKIGQHPQISGYHVTIKALGTGKNLCTIASGSIGEIKTDKPITVGFYGMTKIPMLTETLSPENGGKYKATWGTGIFSPRLSACSRVDILDA